MSPVDRLVALEDIRRVKAEYFRCVDEQDWEALVGVFTPDAETDMRKAVTPEDPSLLLYDAAAFVQSTSAVLTGVKTAHFGYNPRIDLQSDTEATGVWGMEDWLWVGEGHPFLPFRKLHGWGRYYDRYAKVGDRWFMAATKLIRIHTDHE
jgi:hypothetical protein